MRAQWRRSISASLAVLFVLAAYVFYASSGTLRFRTVEWKETFYAGLAEGFLRGQLALPFPADPRLAEVSDPYNADTRAGVPALWDASYFEGKYYLYFSPVPALLLFIPMRVVGGVYPSDALATTLFASIAFLLWVALLGRALRGRSHVPLWLAILLAGVGNVIPYVLVAPAHYQVAITCAMPLTAAWAYALFRFLESPRASLAAMMGMAIGLAAVTRPNMAIIILVAAIPVIVTKNRRAIVAFVLPIAAIAAATATYNYARFRSPFEFGVSYQITLESMRGRRICGVRNAREALRLLNGAGHYLFWAPSLTGTFPFTEVQTHRTDPEVSYAGQPEPVAGTGAVTPLALLGSLCACVLAFRRGPREAVTRAAMYLSAAGWLAMLAVSSCWWITARYALDFTSLMIGGAILALESGLALLAQADVRILPLRVAVALLALYSIVLGLLLPIGRGRPGQGFDQETYRRIERVLSRPSP